MQAVYNATIVEQYELNPLARIIKVRPDSGEVPNFEPGQFTTLGLPLDEEPPKSGPDGKPRVKLIRRAYSMASSNQARDHMEFFMSFVGGGRMTTRLWKRKQGDPIWLSPKVTGEFTLTSVPDGKDLVFVATGTGIAPFVSMIRRYRGTGRWRRAVALVGYRLARDIGYGAELEQVAREDDNFFYVPMVTREPEDSDWRGMRGRVQQALEPKFYENLVGTPLTPEQSHVFMCGNPAMIDGVQAMLEARGFKAHKLNDPGNIHFERYW